MMNQNTPLTSAADVDEITQCPTAECYSRIPHARIRDDHLERSAMLQMAPYFDALAKGNIQVPRQGVRTRLGNLIRDRDIMSYHDLLINESGALFQHFLASIPGILEELCRVGVALQRYCCRQSQDTDFSFVELDGFDGSHSRALAKFSEGRIRTLTTSPNSANATHFHRYARHEWSHFIPITCLRLNLSELSADLNAADFAKGFDFLYETAAFQFYGREREEHIRHAASLLKPNGLAFFLEKVNCSDPAAYLLRERVKDDKHKSLYFSKEEIAWKQRQMLTNMQQGQVSLDGLIDAIGQSFKYVFVVWNSTNFYELVASNNIRRIEDFLELLGPVHIQDDFVFENGLPRRHVYTHGVRDG